MFSDNNLDVTCRRVVTYINEAHIPEAATKRYKARSNCVDVCADHSLDFGKSDCSGNRPEGEIRLHRARVHDGWVGGPNNL